MPKAPLSAENLPDPNDPKCPHASTIVILRDAPRGVETFMLKRHAKSRFMADRYVYPGGKLDPEDCTLAAARRAQGRSPADVEQALAMGAAQENTAPGTMSKTRESARHVATGLFLAGIRETFEEAGILLARRAGEQELIDLTSDPAVARRFQRYRERLMRAEIALSQVAEAEELIFPLDLIAYFSHWITPYRENRRYNTRFFLARAPANQRPLHDSRETVASTWITPQEAVRRNQSGALLLAPPTLHTLIKLAEFSSADAAFSWAIDHRPSVVLPHVCAEDSGDYVLLPGDAAFPDDDPAYRQATPIQYGVSRMRLASAGVWRPVQQ